MGFEQINKIEKVVGTLNKTEKINKIKNSLSNIKDTKNIALENIKDAKNRNDLKRKLLNITIDYDGDILEGAIKYALSPIIDTVLEQYDSFINAGVGDIQDFLTDKFSYIQNLVSNKLNIQDIKIRNFVDTVYSVGYSFEKQGNKYYVVLDPETNNRVDLSTIVGTKNIDALNAINDNKDLVDSLDEVIVERSFTGQGLNIQEMVEILRTIGINPENEESMKKIRPKDLAQAYLNYYSKKLEYSPIPQLNKPNEIKNFLNDTRIKLKIPNEKVTYIKLVQKNAFGTDINDSTEHDTEILRNMMSDFSKLTKITSGELIAVKEAASNAGGMIKEGMPGLMKYMNGPEGLILGAGLIFALFFSDFKKEAWLGILGFTGLNVLTKAYNQDNNKGILQSVGNAIESEVGYKTKLPAILKGLDRQDWLKENNSNINTIAIISGENFKEIMEKSKVNGDGTKIEIQDFSIFDGIDQKELEKLWPAGNWKKKVNDLLTQFIDKSSTKTGTELLSLEKQKDALFQEYTKPKYANSRLSTVIADVLLWNVTTIVNTGNNNTPTLNNAVPILSNIPNNIQIELNKITDISTRNNLAQNISQAISGSYTKTAILADINAQIGLPFITSVERLALEELKIKINTI